ncbi:MAG: M20 family metallopeptidase [Candidatus Bathyarchaeia archaeon]
MSKFNESLDKSWTLDLLKEMVAIPSIVGEERELAYYLRTKLEELGLDARLQEVEDERFNVIASMAFTEDGPTLMFNSHMDTVPVCEGWSTDPFKPVIRENKLYGLGSADMKGGIACALGSIKAILDANKPLTGKLFFTGVVGEEAYSKGAKSLLETEVADVDAVIIGEPHIGRGEGAIPLGITGKILYNINVKGRSAHGFRPEEGVNAIDEAALILLNLDKLRLGKHPKFNANYCTLKIEGGYEVYSVMVPDRCRIEINRMLVPGEDATSAVRDMDDLINSLDLKSDVEVLTKPPFYKSFEMDPDTPFIEVFNEAYKAVFGIKPDYTYSTSITDGNVFTGEGGIPSIHLGPGGGGIHQPDEYVHLNDLEPVMETYALTADKFLR